MKKQTQNIIIYGFLIYIIIGVIMFISFPDSKVVSAEGLQNEGDVSVINSYIFVVIRSVIGVLFWPTQVYVFLFY